MTKLEYTFKHDTLIEMLFVKWPNLLKKPECELLGMALWLTLYIADTEEALV